MTKERKKKTAADTNETAQRFRTQRAPRAYYTGPAINDHGCPCPHCKSPTGQRVVRTLTFPKLTRRYMKCGACGLGWVKNTPKQDNISRT